MRTPGAVARSHQQAAAQRARVAKPAGGARRLVEGRHVPKAALGHDAHQRRGQRRHRALEAAVERVHRRAQAGGHHLNRRHSHGVSLQPCCRSASAAGAWRDALPLHQLRRLQRGQHLANGIGAVLIKRSTKLARWGSSVPNASVTQNAGAGHGGSLKTMIRTRSVSCAIRQTEKGTWSALTMLQHST